MGLRVTHADRPQQKVAIDHAYLSLSPPVSHYLSPSLPISSHLSPYLPTYLSPSLPEQVTIEDASAGAREYLAEHAQQAYRRGRRWSPPTWTDPADQP